jgi:hypothetical protein
VLFAIWELQSEPGGQGRGVTREEIAEKIRKSANRVSGIIHGIRSVSDSYLKVSTHPRPGREGKKGHPLNHYHLNQTEFVTIPETAIILLELSAFPQEMRLRINRHKFVRDLVRQRKVNEPESFIQRRLTWAIEKSYLYGREGDTFIWPGERIDCEREYLKLVAAKAA